MKLAILNLPRSFSEDDLAKLFKEYGSIKSCTLVMDAKTGESKGFGFVDMVRQGAAEEAIAALNGFVIKEKKIRVKKQ